MKKFYFAALLTLSMMTANAQEPTIPRGMFGAPQVDVKFDEYKAAPQGFDQERDGIAKGIMASVVTRMSGTKTVASPTSSWTTSMPMERCPT